MKDSIDYYQRNARSYAERTFSLDMTPLHAKFIPYLPEGGHILDAGCGSGRDAAYFLQRGFRVTAFDASPAMVNIASARVGQNVLQRKFSDVNETSAYDGIWACASLLHLSRHEIPDALYKLWAALKPGGALYISFKAGKGEQEYDGRRFTYVDEQQAIAWIEDLCERETYNLWRTEGKHTEPQQDWLNIIIKKKAAAHNKLITGGKRDHFLPRLCQSIKEASEIDMAVAFIKTTGLNLLIPDLMDSIKRQDHPARLRILTSDYLDITDPDALRKLLLLQEHGASVRVFQSQKNSFHLKAYIFSGYDSLTHNWGRAYIGSSNISRQALQDGLEWNYQVDYPGNEGYLEATSRFHEIFDDPNSITLNDAWIDEYTKRRRPPPQPISPGSDETEPPPVPTDVQRKALAALDDSRNTGYRRGLVVLATGLGKTWLSAFDSAQIGARRILFVAHREEILYQAAETFLRIRPGSRVGYYKGGIRDTNVDILCASIQTLGKEDHLERFSPQHFDYIVIDEFHHAAAPIYHRLLNYFSPSFLLGLTATPDRTDRSDILSLCDDNLVYEYQLLDGIRDGFLVPFQYFGIHDADVNYDEIPWRNGKFDPNHLANKLATLARARHALRIWNQRKQLRTLAFCVSRNHADFMADQFIKAGVPAASVHGTSSISRGEALEKLQNNELSVVFSVDLFNEGVDLPEIDTVLLLRPTESKILFIQQIGRGLRLSPGKQKLAILDFVGNHHSFFHKPQALMGQTMSHRELASFAKNVENDTLELPIGCFINYDLEIINFLKSLDKRDSENDYANLRETLGRRPTLTEYYRFGASITHMRRQHGSWFELARFADDLNENEHSVLSEFKNFLTTLETTKMTKSFKMILVQAFQELNGWKTPPTLEDLSERSWEIIRRRPNLHADITDRHQLTEYNGDYWLPYWKSNPIKAWTSKGNNETTYFYIEKNRFCSTLSPPYELENTFISMVQEIIDYRLALYTARQTSLIQVSPSNFGKVEKHGTELPFFSTLKIACGHFRNSRAETEEYKVLPESYGQLDPARHFIAQASGDSMNGGGNPIKDGDHLLLEHIGSSNAGSITGTTLAIEKIDETGDTQYLLRKVKKTSSGAYVLVANNPDYEDIIVTPELSDQITTFARLKATISPLDMAVGAKFKREEIPSLFNELFNPGNWHSGHVFLKNSNAHVLLVTLNKQGKKIDHRYVDHWIDDKTFHWQSQKSTTPESKRGRDIIHHKEKEQSIHLFVRENKLINGKSAPFVYYGAVEYVRHEGSCPMSVIFKLLR